MSDNTNSKQMRIVDGHTRVCGLIGNPVEHTSSPAIHNTLAGICGHNLVYVPMKVERGQVVTAIKGAYELDILGLNVTVPHKLEVMDALVAIDDLAAQIGAVNTLVRVPSGYKGYNTDILGLERALLSEGMDLNGRVVVLLGAGGAARAAAFLCARMNASKAYILNRSVDKAESLAADVNSFAGRDFMHALALDKYMDIPEDNLVVLQATSIGLSPNIDDAPIDDKAFYAKVDLGFDLIYRPAETKFMKLVNEMGGKSANGLKMLLYQAIIAYELWNEVSISDEQAMEVLAVLEETVR